VIWAATRAEWFRVVRRPATWVVIGLFVALAVAIGYVTTYLVGAHPPANAPTNLDFSAMRASVYPNALVPKSIAAATTIDGLFALILGVLVQGSEFAWGTVKTAQTQLPGRLTVIGGRLLSLAGLLLVMTAGLFAVDALASTLFASIDGKSITFPDAWAIARGLAATWLIFAFMAAFGFGLATLFKQSAMAIGIGLAYVLLLETLVFGLLGGLGDTVKAIHVWFPVANAGYLAQSFGKVATIGNGGGAISGTPDASAAHAVAVLALWIAGLMIISGALVRQRDIA
jgi:ABC-2 type transport system permease protein